MKSRSSMAPKVRINLYRPVQKDCEIRPASLESILKFFDWADRGASDRIHQRSPLFSALLCGDHDCPRSSGSSSIRITQDGSIYPSTYLLFENFLEISGIFIWTQTFRETRAPTGYYMHRFHLPVKKTEGIRMPGRCFGPQISLV